MPRASPAGRAGPGDGAVVERRAAIPASSDKAPDIRGMAVKFRTPSGETDLLGQTAPRFPVRDPEAFIQLTEAGAKPYLLPLFMARHPSSAPAVLANLRAKTLVPPHSYAEVTFYPIHAYGWLAADGVRSWVRYVLPRSSPGRTGWPPPSRDATGSRTRWRPGSTADLSASTCR